MSQSLRQTAETQLAHRSHDLADPFPGESIINGSIESEATNTIIQDRYELRFRLGSGGMGAVWVAWHRDLRIQVALKLLQRQAAVDPEFRARFFREARAVAQVRHPNIVQIYDVGETDDGRPYIVMEYVEGRTLSSMIGTVEMTWPRARGLLLQIADAMQYSHEQGIIHRDLKPENILISERNGRYTCKLIDFGLAKFQELDAHTQQLTRAGSVFGTPQYMSPEQIRGETVDKRADIYALGCVSFECVTGQQAFTGETLNELLSKHLFRPAPELEHATKDGLALQALIHDAVAKSIHERLPSMEEFYERLEAIPADAKLFRAPAKTQSHRNRSFRYLSVWLVAAGVLLGLAVSALVLREIVGDSQPAQVSKPSPSE